MEPDDKLWPRLAKKYNTAHQGPQFIIGLHYFIIGFHNFISGYAILVPGYKFRSRQFKKENEKYMNKRRKKKQKRLIPFPILYISIFFWGGGYVRLLISYWCVSHFSIVLFSIIPEADPLIRIRIKMIRIRNNEFFYNLQFPN